MSQQLRYSRGIIISPRPQYDAILVKKYFDRLTETKVLRAAGKPLPWIHLLHGATRPRSNLRRYEDNRILVKIWRTAVDPVENCCKIGPIVFVDWCVVGDPKKFGVLQSDCRIRFEG